MSGLKNALYLVVDPMPGLKATLPRIEAALEGGVDVIQLWNNWDPTERVDGFINALSEKARRYHVPVIINERWEWLKTLPLDGIHFEGIPKNFNGIKEAVKRRFLTGITCGNDMETIHWAIRNKLDYISFCSVFPSSTANSCELVRSDIIKQARAMTEMPIYAAGGITCDNISSLLPLGIDGVAVVSGIMSSTDPQKAARQFKNCLAGRR